MRTPSVFDRCIARVLLAIVSFQLAFGTQLAAAQAAPAPADTRTTVTTSANGTPVVNIATPNSAGVSHNKFNTYDVAKGGLILNNSSVNAVSLIGGGTAANANLAGGKAASLILNEVVKPNVGSLLAGYQEILGSSAELVIANPWGITCNGCGFVNTPRVTLTTGAPTLSAGGTLAGFTITGGQLVIGQSGLDATRQSVLDLIARSVSINGNVLVGSQANGISGELQVLAGSNSFDYANRTGSAIAASDAAPQFAIDSSVLGGMYADRIRLLVNEHGAGVRLAGNVAALADDLVITADGRIELRGAASAGGDLTVNGADVQVALTDSNTYLYGGRDLSIDATGNLDLGTGSIGAQRNLSFTTVGSLTDMGGTNDLRFTNSTGSLTAAAGGDLNIIGGYWTAPQLSLTAADIQLGSGATVYGSRATGDSVSVATPGLLSIAGGKIYSNADATLGAQRIEVNAAGVVASTGALAATVARGSAGGIDNAGALQGDSVSIVAGGDAPTTPTTLHNAPTGQIVATNGLTIGENGATSSVGSALVNDGTIAGGTVTIGTTDTSNTNAIQATTALALNSATVENTGQDALINGSTSASGSATLTANTITNSGKIWSAGDLTLSPTTLTQQRVAGATANPLIGAGRDLTVAYTGNADLGTGDLQAGRDLTITGSAITDRGGVATSTANGDLRYAGRNLVATAASGGSVQIAGGQWYSNGDLRLTGEDVILGRYFDQQLGTSVYVSGVQLVGAQSGTGAVALNARSGHVSLNMDAGVYSGCSAANCQNTSGGDLLITQSTPFTLNQPNVLQANGLLSISAGGTIDNSGRIQGGRVSLASNEAAVALTYFNRSTGALAATQSIQIGTSAAPAGNIDILAPADANSGIFGGVLEFNAANLLNNGTLQGVGPGSTITLGFLQNNGSIQGFANSLGQGSLTLNAGSITNIGTLFDQSLLAINVQNLINTPTGSIASPGLLQLMAGGTAGAAAVENLGQIGGGTLDLQFLNGLVNGLDPGNPANRGQQADIFATNFLGIRISNGSTLTNYAKIESDMDLDIGYIGTGNGSLVNQMSMVPDSELTWVADGNQPVTTYGGVFLLGVGQNGKTDKHEITVDSHGTVYYFGNILQTDAYQDARSAFVQNQDFLTGSDPVGNAKPTIRAGNDLNIAGFANVLNNGTMEAVNNATITSTLVQNTTLNFGQRNRNVDFVESFTCHLNTGVTDAAFGCGSGPNEVQDNGPYGGFTPVTSFSAATPGTKVAFAGKIIAGNILTINGNLKNSGTPDPVQLPAPHAPNKAGAVTVIPAGAPGSLGTAPTLSINGAKIPVPTSTSGRFISAQNSTKGPLVETNPLFGIDSIGLGSDYLAKLLGLNPDAEDRRLGDDNYEAYLIQQQVVALTGRSVLQAYGYAGDMEQALFDNAGKEAKTLDLGYGKALTAQQVASLTSDIVWMVEQVVQGQKVLVPVVYLTDATQAQSLNGGGPTLAGYNVNINGGTVTNTGGNIVATNALNINATGNIENLSGNISGWNVRLNAGGDIVNSTLVTRLGDQSNGQDIAQRTATINAGNVAILNAGRDITVNGATVNAAKDAVLIAGNNVNIQSFALTRNVSSTDNSGSTTIQLQSARQAGVTAGGDAVIQAGQDVNIKGADVAANGTANIRAERGNVNVGALDQTFSSSSSNTTTGLYTQLDSDKTSASATLGVGVEHKTTTDSTTRTTGLGSSISGNGVVVSTGAGDVNINGSSVSAGTDGITVDSARDVNITAYNNKTQSTHTTDRVRAGYQMDASADGVFGGAAESGDKTSTTTTQTTAQVSSLNSGGNIVINGAGTVTNEGTQLGATGDIDLLGNNVINKAAQDTYTQTTTESKWEAKQQEGLTTNGTGDSINNAAQGNGNQVSVNNLEFQQRVTGSYSTDTSTNQSTTAHGATLNAGGNIVVSAKNGASDEGTQYVAGKNVAISAENYENKAAADTSSSSNESTYGSGKATVGLNSSAEVALTASADGGHTTSGTSQSSARVGTIVSGGAVSIAARSGDVTLEGTTIHGEKGVSITAANDVNINQANNTTTTSSSEKSGSGRLSGSVSLLGTGGSVGVGASTRIANSNDTTSTATAANISGGGGDVQIAAGRDLTSQGANVATAGNVNLTAGRDVKLLAATDKTDKTGSVDSGGTDVNVGFGTDAAEDTGSGGANVNFERGRTDYHETTQHGSNITAGGNVAVNAGRDATLQDTKVDANSASLATGGNLVLESAQHTIKDNSYDVSSALSASVSKGGGTSGASSVGQGSSGSTGAKGGNAAGGGAQVNVMQSKQDIETNTNATINTSGGTTVAVGGDMSLKGANINAQGGVSGKVAGNLTVESRTDKEIVDQTDVKAYAGLGPVGGSGGGGKSQHIQEGVQTGANAVGQTGVFTDVNAQKKDNVTLGTASGISGGSAGINVNVGGNTALTGASNKADDFKTAGTTTVQSVDTHSSESVTKFRVDGTVASAAGSDNGKGGDYGLSVHTPGSHGGAPEDDATHPNPGVHEPDAPAPTRPRAETPYANTPPGHAATTDPSIQAPRPRTDTVYANTPPGHNAPTDPSIQAPRPRAGTVYANTPPGGDVATDPNTQAPRPRAGTVYANTPPGGDVATDPNTQAPRPRANTVYANTPPGRDAANDPNAQVPHPRGEANPEPDLNVQPFNGPSNSQRDPLPQNPGAASGNEAPNTKLAKADSPPSEPRNVQVNNEVRALIDADSAASALRSQGSHLAPVDRQEFERNLAEIIAFTSHTNDAPLRDELFTKIQASLAGPQRHGKDLTEFPLQPQYVGENVPGFEHWSSRKDQPLTPGQNYGDGAHLIEPPVEYFSPRKQELSRLYVKDGVFVTPQNLVKEGDGLLKAGAGGGSNKDQWNFVVTPDGVLRVAVPDVGVSHHSSLAAGDPVLAAGSLTFDAEGKLVGVSNESGHFRPTVKSLQQFVDALRNQGVDFTGVKVEGLGFRTNEDGSFGSLDRRVIPVPKGKARLPGAKDMLTSLEPNLDHVRTLVAEEDARLEQSKPPAAPPKPENHIHKNSEGLPAEHQPHRGPPAAAPDTPPEAPHDAQPMGAVITRLPVRLALSSALETDGCIWGVAA